MTVEESKVKCPDCGKQMSAKTLKYSHVPNCVKKKEKQNKETEEIKSMTHVAKNLVQEIGGPNCADTLNAFGMLSALNSMSDKDVHRMILQGKRAERATRREAMVQNLIKNAF
jgi:uncharacterized Zn-finger protein